MVLLLLLLILLLLLLLVLLLLPDSNNDVIWRTRRDVNNLKVYEGCDSYRQAPDEIEFYVDFLLDGTLAFESRAKEELCVYRAPVLEEMVPNLQKYKKGELLTIKVTKFSLTQKIVNG